MPPMELLAPAGTLEAGIAAFQYGADAVYLGLKDFSARADAGNFTFEELEILSGIAHQVPENPRKIYVTLNTLLREEELPLLISHLVRLRECGIDGIILQDLAVASLVRQYLPEIPIHASTQMAIHNTAGMLAAKNLGFTRVVAARELTLRELTEMATVPDMELEVFLHGALCYSYSGLCLLSAHFRGSSGNRGECSYLCRNRFQIDGITPACSPCCPMSMKDLALGPMIAALRSAGVSSLKIEGRKKTPLYVAAVVNYYRKLLDHSFAPGEEKECMQDVQTIFSRPWTRLFSQSAANRDVTDPHTTGPRGIEIGNVSRVRNTSSGENRLRFTLRNRPLERHDGLQIELPDTERPYGFGVDAIYQFPQGGGDRWTSVFTAEPGTVLEVPLPPGHPELPHGAKISQSSSQAVKRNYSWPLPRQEKDRYRLPLEFHLNITPEAWQAEMFVPGLLPQPVTFRQTLPLPLPLEPARNPEQANRTIQGALERTGGSRFFLRRLTIENSRGCFLPVSLCNDIRRDAIEFLEQALFRLRTEQIRQMEDEMQTSWEKATKERENSPVSLSIKIDSAESLTAFSPEELSCWDEILLALDRFDSADSAKKVLENLENLGVRPQQIRLALPVISRAATRRDALPLAKALLEDGWHRWECSNLGHTVLLRKAGADPATLDLTGDWPLYCTNHLAVQAYREMGFTRMTLCPEEPLDNHLALLERLPEDSLTAVLWQQPVLARSATCLIASARGNCLGPGRCGFTRVHLTSAKQEKLLAVNDRCQTILIPEEPLDLRASQEAYRQAGVRHFRFDFQWTDLSSSRILQITLPFLEKCRQ